ncbi:MAG: hypothetical protein QM758_03490 [Armatimonas sp.]
MLEIPGLTYARGVPEKQELRALISVLCGEIRAARRQKSQALIYDLGTCPAIAAHAALVGQVFHVPVHTLCKSSSLLPTPALRKLQSLTSSHEELLRWIQEESCSMTQVCPYLKELPEAMIVLIESDADGFATLSPLGMLFFEAHLSECEVVRHPSKINSCEH